MPNLAFDITQITRDNAEIYKCLYRSWYVTRRSAQLPLDRSLRKHIRSIMEHEGLLQDFQGWNEEWNNIPIGVYSALSRIIQ
jgi:hypothetical protein